MQDRLLDQWRFRHGVPDDPMVITELSRYRLYDPSKANLASGDALRLVRRPDNEKDPNAVELQTHDGRTVVGYLPREVAAITAPLLDAGEPLTARFHAEGEVASGMVVIHGAALDPVLGVFEALSCDPAMDTGIYAKRRTEDINIEWYDRNAAQYSEGANRCNPRHDMGAFLSALPAGARILDAGCGNGRDIERMLELGYDVSGFDGSAEMCRLTRERTGVSPRHMRFSEYEDAPGTWDGIWAMASLVHTPAEDLPDVMWRLQRSLKPGGALFAAMKAGDSNDVMPDGRRMMRVNDDLIREMFTHDGTPFVSKRVARNSRGEEEMWYNVLFLKAPSPELTPEM